MTQDRPRYTWIAYADSQDGTQNFTTGAPCKRPYIGVAHSQHSAEESKNSADYTWAKFCDYSDGGVHTNTGGVPTTPPKNPKPGGG